MANLRKLVGLGLLLILAGCRQEMYDQPKIKPLAQSDFYPDLRAARPQVEGTVARGQVHADAYLYTGKINGNPGDYMPFPITEADLQRGHERFNIYCAPCHSRLGDGNGMVPQRGYKHPPTYHQDRLRKAPLGYFFDVMTNGYGVMPDYAAQIVPEDRWRIVAYIRALQLSQNATVADAAGEKIPSPLKMFKEPGSGATPATPLPPSSYTGIELK
jgi:mono/diheme cytochrome c family protein